MFRISKAWLGGLVNGRGCTHVGTESIIELCFDVFEICGA